MIVKRLGAIALAVILIGGAWLVRDRVIDDNGGSGDDGPPRADREIVCVSDLREACGALDEALDLDIRIEAAGDTLDAFADPESEADPPIWITMQPLPEMAAMLLVIGDSPELLSEQTRIASSPIALVVPPDRAAVLATACEAPLDWGCIGDAAGGPWAEIEGKDSWGNVRPAFAPIDSAIGLLGVSQAVAGYFEGAPIQPSDTDFVSWARRLSRAVSVNALTGRTAIETIETRPSALDIAVGAAAEFSDSGGSELGLQYADPMIRADVVVAVPEGASMPSGLTDELARLLVIEGRWEQPSTEPNPLPTPVELLAIRSAWMAFT